MKLLEVAIDFETYYDKDYSIKIQGAEGYCADERFDPYMVALTTKDGTEVVDPKAIDWSKYKDFLWLSHNAGFDETVYLEMIKRRWIPDVRPETWECTADLSVYCGAPRSLAGAASALLGIEPDKTVRENMKGKHLKDLSVDERKALEEYAKSDGELCYALWREKGDSWPEAERKVSRLNRYAGRRGVYIDQDILAEARNTLKTAMWEAGNQIPWEWNKTPLAPTKLRAECRKTIIGKDTDGKDISLPCPKSLAADNKECIKWEAKYGKDYPWVGAMRTWRRCNMLLKKFETVASRIREDGTFPYSIKYFGGHTGRFSGSGGFNMQNMPRGEMFGVDLRSIFIPRPGNVFYIMDLAQIEARVILWLAQDVKTLDAVREGLSVYEAHAVATMGHEPQAEPLKKIDPAKYSLAKARVLGLGFGCGAGRFKDLAKTMFGMELTGSEAAKIVADFRNSNPKILRLWGELQRDCVRSANSDFEVELPSGRMLVYHNVTTYPGLEAEVVLGERKSKLYGGKLTENIVQAVARDAFVDGMLRVDKHKNTKLAWHVHDEVILEGPPGQDEELLMKLFTVGTEWADGCPIEAEMVVADKYLK